MSHRKRDSHVEKQVGDFLDCYFYPKIVKDFIRYTDKDNQLIGMDVCFSIDNYKKLIVDEKAASHYINQDIPTFALIEDEIDFKKFDNPGKWRKIRF